MPVYHRTQRLQIFGEKPEIQKLYGSRYRMVVRCVAKNGTRAWYNANKAQIFADFGTLYDAQMSVDGIDARTGEAYPDMVLVENKAYIYGRSEEYLVEFTYETLTDSFVQETEDKVDFDLNGLKRLTRTIIAKDTAAYSSVVGTTTIVGSSPLLTLAQVSEDQLEASQDGFKRIREVWLEGGTLSETIDNVGSQKAKVIETIGADPATPTGYSLASKQESDFEGFQTNRFTFLKDDVILSASEDEVGSQNAITEQWFKPSASRDTKASYSLARKEESDVDGIPTERYTFLKDNVELSRSEDKVGSQLSITTQVFNPTSDPTESGYSLAREEVSDVDGIPTKRFTFLKDNVVLSESEDKVGSQAAIVQEVFNGTPATPSGYVVANEQESDVDGIPTRRYTFLKEDVILSESEDKVGSQLAIVKEVFNGTPDTPGGYSIASKQESDVDGIPTKRYTFLKDNVVLSRSIQTKSGGNLILEVVEVFNGTPVAETTGAVKIGDEVSDVDGIPTRRFTFAKGDGQISVESKPAPVQLAGCTYVTVRSLGTEVTPTGVLVAESETESDGYITYEKTALQGTITGIKQTYKDVVDVEVPGEVECSTETVSISDAETASISGSIAIPKVQPRRSKKISATVTVEIATTPPSTASLAYDLGQISCSVTSISKSYTSRNGPTKYSKTGVFITPFTDWQRSFSPSVRIQVYPGCFLTTSSSSGSVSYTSQRTHIMNADENEDGYYDGEDSTINSVAVSETECIGEGSTSNTGYQTTGVLKRNSRPVLTTLNGTTYYEVITWSV